MGNNCPQRLSCLKAGDSQLRPQPQHRPEGGDPIDRRRRHRCGHAPPQPEPLWQRSGPGMRYSRSPGTGRSVLRVRDAAWFSRNTSNTSWSCTRVAPSPPSGRPACPARSTPVSPTRSPRPRPDEPSSTSPETAAGNPPPQSTHGCRPHVSPTPAPRAGSGARPSSRSSPRVCGRAGSPSTAGGPSRGGAPSSVGLSPAPPRSVSDAHRRTGRISRRWSSRSGPHPNPHRSRNRPGLPVPVPPRGSPRTRRISAPTNRG